MTSQPRFARYHSQGLISQIICGLARNVYAKQQKLDNGHSNNPEIAKEREIVTHNSHEHKAEFREEEDRGAERTFGFV